MSLFAAVCALLAVVDFAGKPVHLFDGSDAKTTVLIFIRTDCPISNRYAPEIQRLYREYSPRAAFYLVYPDATETAEVVHKHMTEYGYVFDALRDPGHELVKFRRRELHRKRPYSRLAENCCITVASTTSMWISENPEESQPNTIWKMLYVRP